MTWVSVCVNNGILRVQKGSVRGFLTECMACLEFWIIKRRFLGWQAEESNSSPKAQDRARSVPQELCVVTDAHSVMGDPLKA